MQIFMFHLGKVIYGILSSKSICKVSKYCSMFSNLKWIKRLYVHRQFCTIGTFELACVKSQENVLRIELHINSDSWKNQKKHSLEQNCHILKRKMDSYNKIVCFIKNFKPSSILSYLFFNKHSLTTMKHLKGYRTKAVF